jgi:hypothetical protein
MVIVKLISGLGNQLFQYAVGRELSLRSGQPMKLDLSFYASQSLRSYKLSNFNINAEIAGDEELSRFLKRYTSRQMFQRIVRNIGQTFPRRFHRLVKEGGEWSYDPEILNLKGDKYLLGYWQHYKYFEKINTRIFYELTVRDEYKTPFAREYNMIDADPGSVSLHIRRGDYITDPEANAKIGTLPLSYYERAVRLLREKVANPSFYVFSDDLDWVKDNLKLPGAVTYMDIDNGSKDYIELELMSHCRYNIIANSSFSWWGAFLNRSPDKLVIAPAQWVRDDELNRRIQIQLPGWIKV